MCRFGTSTRSTEYMLRPLFNLPRRSDGAKHLILLSSNSVQPAQNSRAIAGWLTAAPWRAIQVAEPYQHAMVALRMADLSEVVTPDPSVASQSAYWNV